MRRSTEIRARAWQAVAGAASGPAVAATKESAILARKLGGGSRLLRRNAGPSTANLAQIPSESLDNVSYRTRSRDSSPFEKDSACAQSVREVNVVCHQDFRLRQLSEHTY